MKIVLYGAGKRGKKIFEFLRGNGYGDFIYGFCDRNADKIREIAGIPVWLPDEISEHNIIYCITLLDKKEREQIRNELGEEKCIDFSDLADLFYIDKVKFNRDFCAFYHTEGMDAYFDEAEKGTDIFWNQDSEFYRMFQKLNISKIIELGCGHGRHVSNYIEGAGEITLVDILQKNIDICKKRFGESGKVKYYKNDGYDLRDLDSDMYTALYSYDAMVHFELIDIYSYLKDIHRVLLRGG